MPRQAVENECPPRHGAASASPLRRPFTTRDYKHLVQHYPDQTAGQCAAALGRTRGSIYAFIARYPELRKQGRP